MPAPTPPERLRSPLVLAGAAIAGLGLVVLAGAYATAEVVDQGRLLPWTPANAKEVEIFGGYSVTVHDEPPDKMDAVGAGVFMGLAAVSLLMALVAPLVRLRWFWGLLAAGALALGLDEVLGGHETIGANVRVLGDLPGVDAPDDVVIALYAVPTAAFLWLFRDRVLSSRPATLLIGIGVGLYVVAAALDVLDAFLDEQPVELASTAALFAGFLALALRDLRERDTAPTPARAVAAAG